MEQIKIANHSVFAVVVPRGPYWLVRLTGYGLKRPLWRRYLRADYPDPDTVVTRCLSGLIPEQKTENETQCYGINHIIPVDHFAPPGTVRVSWWGWL